MRKIVNIQDWSTLGLVACTMCRAYNGSEPCEDDDCEWSRELCLKFLKPTSSPVFQSEE